MSERKPSCVTGVDSIRPQKVRLVEVCKVNTTTPPAYEGEKPYVSTGAVINSKIEDSQVEYWSYEERPSRANLFPSKGDILFAKMKGTRKTLLIDDLNFSALYSTGFYALSPQTDKIDVRFLFHYLDSEAFLSAKDRECKGATQKALNNAGLCKIRIPLPPLSLQQQIAARLDRVCKIVTKRRTQLVQLQQLVKSRFVEMFGDAKYPERELITVTTFIDYRGKTPTKSDSGVPLITAKNVRANGFSVEPREYMPETLFAEWMTRGFPRVGDVLFTTEAPLGNVCRIPNLYGRFAVGQRIVTMQVMQEVLDPSYLEHALKSDSFQRKIKQKSSGSTVTGIRSKLLEKLTVPIPPLALQREFAAFVEKVDKLAFAVRKSLGTAEKLYRQQLAEAFS